MKIITEAELTSAIEDCLCEVFELVVGQRAYLEVLTNETDYVGTLIEYETDLGFHNATNVFDLDLETRKYAFERAVTAGDAKQSFFAYDSLSDAKAHATALLFAKLDGYEE
jgi:hypothetical protein